jgi:hypothetical protein
MTPTSSTPDGDLCSTSRDPKCGEEALRVIEQHLGPPHARVPGRPGGGLLLPPQRPGVAQRSPQSRQAGPWPDADQDRPCPATVVEGAVAVVEGAVAVVNGVAESEVELRDSNPSPPACKIRPHIHGR